MTCSACPVLLIITSLTSISILVCTIVIEILRIVLPTKTGNRTVYKCINNPIVYKSGNVCDTVYIAQR